MRIAVFNFFVYCGTIYKISFGRYIMDVRVGDELVMKKAHPCGENRFEVLRSGIDFRLRCKKCGREVMVPRIKIEKNIKKIIREESPNDR